MYQCDGVGNEQQVEFPGIRIVFRVGTRILWKIRPVGMSDVFY